MDLLNTDGSVHTGPDGVQYGAVIVRIGKRDVILGTYQFAPGAIAGPNADGTPRVSLDATTTVSTAALAQALVEVAVQVDPRIQARAETIDGDLIYGTLPVAPEGSNGTPPDATPPAGAGPEATTLPDGTPVKPKRSKS